MFRFLAACTVRLYRTDKCCECYVYGYAKQTVASRYIYNIYIRFLIEQKTLGPGGRHNRLRI